MHWYLDVLKKYATFSGRARRQEYWMFTLFHLIVATVLIVLDFVAGTYPIIYGIYVLATLLPSLAVSVRRLHDTNRSGWWLLIGAVPLVGGIVLLVFMVSDSTGDNERGANPKGAALAH